MNLESHAGAPASKDLVVDGRLEQMILDANGTQYYMAATLLFADISRPFNNDALRLSEITDYAKLTTSAHGHEIWLMDVQVTYYLAGGKWAVVKSIRPIKDGRIGDLYLNCIDG